MVKRIYSSGVYLFILIAPILFIHWRVLFQGWILCEGDAVNQFVPWREFALSQLKSGSFPFWNPFVFCGTPFAANIQTSLFYPFNLFNLVFSVEWTFSLSLALHHVLSALGMYIFLSFLCRSKAGAVIGAMVYSWSGFFITHGGDGHLIHIRAYAFIPFVLYFQSRLRDQFTLSRFFLFGLGFALMFFGGHTQIPLYIFYLVMFRAVWWAVIDYRTYRSIRGAFQYPMTSLSGFLLSLCLAAVVILPLFQLSRHTAERAGGASYQFATHDSMPPSHLVTFFAPFFYGDPTGETKEDIFWETRTGYHEICGYTGIIPFFLIFFIFLPLVHFKQEEKENSQWGECYFFIIAGVLGLFFALGKYNPLYPLIYYGLPGWSYFRVPGRLVLIFIIGVSVWSAFGVKRWEQIRLDSITNHWALKFAGVLSFFVLIFTIILWLSKPAVITYLRELEIDRTIMEYRLWTVDRMAIGAKLPDILFETRYSWMLYSSVGACVFLGMGWLALFLMKKVVWRWTWLLLAIVVMADLMYFGQRFFDPMPSKQWKETHFPQSELVGFLQENSDGHRIMCLDDAIGQPGLQYHPELRPNRLMHYGIQTVRGYDPIILNTYTQFVNRMYDKPPDSSQGGLLFFPTIPPYRYLNMMNVKYILTTQTLNKPYQVVWEKDDTPLKVYQNPNTPGMIFGEDVQGGFEYRIEKQTSNHLTLLVEKDPKAESPTHLVWSQSVYPAWGIQIDGKRVDTEPYPGTFQRFEFRQDKQKINVDYIDQLFNIGLLISFVGFFVIGLFIVLKRTGGGAA